jgi:hypothetical protein
MDDSPKILCYAITHAGEGERGESVEIKDKWLLPRECAEHAARHFNDLEMIQNDWTIENIGLFNSTSSIIEVVGYPFHPEPIRFRVRCEVVREYEAERVD